MTLFFVCFRKRKTRQTQRTIQAAATAKATHRRTLTGEDLDLKSCLSSSSVCVAHSDRYALV